MFDARAKAVTLSLALLLSGAGFMVQPATAASFDNVQIFANPVSSAATNFQFAAYNLSGNLVASYQGPYPAAAFELPPGGYLFTVSANDRLSRIGYACPLAQGGTAAPAPSTSPPKPGTTAIIPWCYPPSSEYGYSAATITGPQSITIDLKNASTLPTTPVTVKASFVNGTAAAGAEVYASVVGEWYYYWWYQGGSVKMSGQTDSNGIAHLVVPVAPVVVTAWKWVPVYMKADATTKVDVGGQEVNVTAYWEPTYVGLSATGLIIPPQNSITLTLRYQQPAYWAMGAGIASKQAYVSGAPSATEASQPTGTPSSVSNSNAQNSNQYLPSSIPAFQLAGAQTSGSQPGPSMEVIFASAVAFVAAALGVFYAARRRGTSTRPPTLAG